VSYFSRENTSNIVLVCLPEGSALLPAYGLSSSSIGGSVDLLLNNDMIVFFTYRYSIPLKEAYVL